MKFDLILTNPPFQDRGNRGRTPHKLWIEFTEHSLNNLLTEGGTLCQVSPSSFQSPSNRILDLMKKYDTQWIHLDTAQYFEGVASSFADYAICKTSNTNNGALVVRGGASFRVLLNQEVMYLPNDLSDISLEIHRKVIFETSEKLKVERDYVTCHNILLRKSDSLSKDKTEKHKYPVLHTNNQTWWSSIKQGWADSQKVMWSRSGYTLPFFDDGKLGGTDMVYFVRVSSEDDGRALASILNSKLFRYIFKTAKWSGFGNEKVFDALPVVPLKAPLDDAEVYSLFSLNAEEVNYVESVVGKNS
jgi:hypothetical protein